MMIKGLDNLTKKILYVSSPPPLPPQQIIPLKDKWKYNKTYKTNFCCMSSHLFPKYIDICNHLWHNFLCPSFLPHKCHLYSANYSRNVFPDSNRMCQYTHSLHLCYSFSNALFLWNLYIVLCRHWHNFLYQT